MKDLEQPKAKNNKLLPKGSKNELKKGVMVPIESPKIPADTVVLTGQGGGTHQGQKQYQLV